MLEIKTLCAKDIEEAVGIINMAYRGQDSARGWTHELEFLEGGIRADKNQLEQIINDPKQLILVAVAENEIVGTIHLREDNEGLYFGLLSVHPDRQNRGIGQVLLAAAESDALRRGMSRMYMIVISERTELIAWYERKGFRKTGKKEPFSPDPKFGKTLKPLFIIELEKIIETVPGNSFIER